MIPYADFLYFGILLIYIALPTVLLGLLGWSGRWWILLTTAGMVALQYGGTTGLLSQIVVREGYLVLGYAVFQWLIAWAYLRLKLRRPWRWPFYLAVTLSLLPLVLAKFLPLLSPSYLVGFLGLSYVTFRALDVVFGIQAKTVAAVSPLEYLAYMLFFPTISSGPIDRYKRFLTDLKLRRSRAEFLLDVDGAIHRVFTGFLYKFILAALIKRYWLDPAGAGTGLLDTVSYMYAYSLYLFFDFAGYSAFAVGVSYLLGVHTPENFRQPFLARNIRDFWDRWHISLSWWFRDNIYMRFLFAATRGKWFKSRYTASYLGFFLTMGLMGLWHGTAWHYIIYGLYHGTLLVVSDMAGRWNKQHHLWSDTRLWRAAGIALTFNLVCFGLLIFSGRLGS